MEVQIEKGIGYLPREKKRKEKMPIGTILVDAIFTPIKRVAFKVENMRVGERTDFDRLFLEIETDGTISPEEAFLQASEIVLCHFSLFQETFKKEEKKVLPKKSGRKKKS
jgi:DNA-directed RNA polymerase subunit alpha